MSERGTWQTKVMGALVLLLAIAVGARLVWELLAPVVPVLIVLAGVSAIYVLIFRAGRF